MLLIHQKMQAPSVAQPEVGTAQPNGKGVLNSQYSGSHSGDSSSGGPVDQSEQHVAGAKGQASRSSNSGEHDGPSQRALAVKKSTCERDKNKVAQRAFRQRKKEKEKAKCASAPTLLSLGRRAPFACMQRAIRQTLQEPFWCMRFQQRLSGLRTSTWQIQGAAAGGADGETEDCREGA